MADIGRIRTQLEAIYSQDCGQDVEVPPAVSARMFGGFAREYLAAAEVLEQASPHHFLARLQLTGQAVELALKSYMLSRHARARHGHDLLELLGHVQGLGFPVNDLECAALVHLNHFYFKDLSSGTKYKARYPTSRTEPLGGAVPKHATFQRIVEALLNEADAPESKPPANRDAGR